jgi:hypothetical protein
MLALVSDPSGNAVNDLVSAFVQALNAVTSNNTARSEEGEDSLVRRVIVEFDALGGSERDQVAQALTQLWDSFNERFDGLHGFLSADFADRYDYVRQLEKAGERMARYRHCAAAHYYQSTVLMLAYVRALLQQQSLGSRVIEAVHRGRILSREGPLTEVNERIRHVPAPLQAETLLAAF